MLEIKDGKIYVEGVETIDPELIGMAFLDFAENIHEDTVFDSSFPMIKKYEQEYQDKQRLADEIVNDFEDW